MSEFRDNSGELVVSRLLTSKLGIQSQRGNKKVCKNNVYNSEQWVVNIVDEMSNVNPVKQSDWSKLKVKE